MKTNMKREKLYITPKEGKNCVFTIVHESGEALARHFCSNLGYARSDLESGRPERQKEWKKRFGNYEVLIIGDDDLTDDELIKRNHELFETNPKEE